MIKKALVSAWISVFAGVSLFAASTAFGATVMTIPNNQPPSGFASPTFSGLTVSGNIMNGSNVDTNPVTINDSLNIYKDLKIWGAISSSGYSSQPVTIHGSLKVEEALDVSDNISLTSTVDDVTGKLGTFFNVVNTYPAYGAMSGIRFRNGNESTYKGGIFFQDKNTEARGDMVFAVNTINDSSDVAISDAKLKISSTGEVSVTNTLTTNGLVTTNGLAVTGNSTLGGAVTASGKISANNGLAVTGDSTLGGAVTASGKISANSGLAVTGTTTTGAVTASGKITANSGLAVTGTTTTGALTASGKISTNSGLAVTGDSTFGGDVEIDGLAILNGFLTVYTLGNTTADPVEISDSLAVVGKITANAIGTFSSNKQSTLLSVDPGATGIVSTPACDVGGFLINCSMEAYTSGGSASDGAFLIRKLESDYSSRTCKVVVKNDWTATRSVQATSLCFYPNK